jgi:hypothetical protein
VHGWPLVEWQRPSGIRFGPGKRWCYAMDQAKKMIFIAGCARSGTTLTRNLMGCFSGVHLESIVEHQYLYFYDINTSASTIVLKRTNICFRSLYTFPAETNLIYCVRHPFDVLTSVHEKTKHLRRFHVDPTRWISEYRGLLRLRKAQPDRSIFLLRYEDLVRRPDDVMAKLVKRFDLVSQHSFSENPMGYEIHARSVGKWVTNPDLQAYLLSFPTEFRNALVQFSRQFQNPCL